MIWNAILDGRPMRDRVLWLPYAPMKTTPEPLLVERAEGVRFTLADGRVLLDGVSNWWTACHGHGHPALRDAAIRQLEAAPHVMLGGLAAPTTDTLARRLAGLLPGELRHERLSRGHSARGWARPRKRRPQSFDRREFGALQRLVFGRAR